MSTSHQTPAAASRPSPAVAAAGSPSSPCATRTRRGEDGSASWRDVPDCPLAPALQAMAEDKGDESVEAHLRAYLRDFGLTLAYHPWRQHAKRAREGWPDWSLAGPGGFMVRELKRQREKPTPAQEAWLDAMEAAGVDVGVWKPCCVLSGRMARQLAALAGIGVR